MDVKELLDLLHEKNIELVDFKIVSIIPTIEINNGKEKVTEFRLYMERKTDDEIQEDDK